ncbi:MAG: DUF1735 domain-containing protein [Tannerella sp.]|jgi:hypothetical protein|nr:DUF1735 domain-containing protein [Tannerella sp.]
MKHIARTLLTISIAVVFFACGNFDHEFDDYAYTAGYFPYQYPVRTLVLGDYIYDNTNDNAHKFVISVAMGGVYDNTKNREFQVVVDESLCNNLLFSAGGDEIKALPSNYYNLSSPDKIVIPKGEYNGGVEVQLTDAFFNDPAAIKNTYVVPMRIVGSSDVDTILLSKNYTLFAVKFINEFQGTYFHYGTSSVKDPSDAVVENTLYNTEKYVEYYPTADLITTGRYQVSTSFSFESKIFTGSLSLLLDFNGSACTISAPPGSAYTVQGAGEFKSKVYEWGNKKRDGLVMTYTVTSDLGTYTANDELVLRDRPVVMEVFSPVEND